MPPLSSSNSHLSNSHSAVSKRADLSLPTLPLYNQTKTLLSTLHPETKAYATRNYHRDQQVNQLPRHLAGEGLQLSKGFLRFLKKSINMSSSHSPDHDIPN